MKNLYVIDGLINAYALRKIESLRKINFDIMVAINTNLYDRKDFICAVKNIVYPLNCDRMFVANDNLWAYERNWGLRKKIDKEIAKSGLHNDAMHKYCAIYLNPFTSGVAAMLSTKGVKTYFLSHGSFDLFRFTNFHYHAFNIWIKSGIFIRRGSLCYGMVDLKQPRNDLINITRLSNSISAPGKNLEQQYSPAILNKKLLKLKNERLLFLLWTQRDEGENRDFNEQIIQLNLELIQAFFRRHPHELGKLVCLVKCHKSADQTNFGLFKDHMKEFKAYFKDFIFFHKITDSAHTKFIPVELLVDALSPIYMLGSSSSALWNCAGREGLTVYQAFLYGLGITKLSIYGQRVYKKLIKVMSPAPLNLM